MANPQPTDAHLRMAHSINEQLMVSHFSEQQRRILDFILRLSWGCGTKVAYIPRQRDFEIVGVREGHVKAHLDWLVEAKVILRQDCYYRFNKDFDQWRVSRAAGYTKRKLTDIVSLNLNHNKPKLTESVSENLRKREDIAYGKGKFPTTNLATPKESIKESIKESKEEEATTSLKRQEIEFNEFIKELRLQYPDVDFDNELQKFRLYWSEGGRKLKRPKLALKNWMDKAREFKQEGKRGAHRQSSRELKPRQAYKSPEEHRIAGGS